MSCIGTSDCTCGCCAGIGIETPVLPQNLPGQPEIAYRAGTWTTFRESMLARLSSADYPALTGTRNLYPDDPNAPLGLKTRDTDDFSIALLDASAVVLDILTFYQERLANESYLRTATQPRSLTELARLVGYRPAPGVAAETWLAFTLKAATGLPADPSTTAITIPAGTQVQSVPAQDQTPQTFETATDILAKADWNALPVMAGVPWTPPGGTGMYLAGTSTKLAQGDSILILGASRESWDGNGTPDDYWDVITLNAVVPDQATGLTWVGWDRRMDHKFPQPSSGWTIARMFALRQKTTLFGAAAPDARLFVNPTTPTLTSLPTLIDTTWNWIGFKLTSSAAIDLSAAYPKIVVGSWFALIEGNFAQLYEVLVATAPSRSDFGLSAQVTRLSADYADPDIGTWDLRKTRVLAESEQLVVARQPIDHPLYGNVIDIDALRPDLVGAQAIALTGKAQKLAVASGAGPLTFAPDDGPDNGSQDMTLYPGDVVTLISPGPLPKNGDGSTPDWRGSPGLAALRVADASGRTGTISAFVTDFVLAASAPGDPDIREFALVASVLATKDPFPHTRITLQDPLTQVYTRLTAKVNANVGLATAGRSVSEIMGSGAAATPNQSFVLKQAPLTYTQATTPDGRASTLQVSADGIKWTEVRTLYRQKPSSRVYETRGRADLTTLVQGGDTLEGATFPTGQNNLMARYRVGSGVASNVGAGSITTLVDRPLGVSSVINPTAATGGQDPQSADAVRVNAPSSVQTLGRAVSIADYQNYAASFGGIAKASAFWIASGPARGVFLTVAGAGGAAPPPGNPTLRKLVTSLRIYGSPHTPIHAVGFLETLFRLEAKLAIDPDYDADVVRAAVIAMLRGCFGFAARGFGQGVSADEIAGLIQGIAGIVAVNVTKLTLGATSTAGDLAAGGWSVYAYHQWLAQTVTVPRPGSAQPLHICPYVPVASGTALPLGAEILVLDPDPDAIALGVLP